MGPRAGTPIIGTALDRCVRKSPTPRIAPVRSAPIPCFIAAKFRSPRFRAERILL
jgi:hypothetical protein